MTVGDELLACLERDVAIKTVRPCMARHGARGRQKLLDVRRVAVPRCRDELRAHRVDVVRLESANRIGRFDVACAVAERVLDRRDEAPTRDVVLRRNRTTVAVVRRRQ